MELTSVYKNNIQEDRIRRSRDPQKPISKYIGIKTASNKMQKISKSKLENTAKRIDSKKKKAIQYSFAWFVKDLFQHNKIQAGIKKAVNRIIINARPSIPKIRFTFKVENHLYFSKN